MEFTDLQIFRAVVDCGGITSAARKLHRVQSNVTTRIKNLEESLGAQLFDRSGRKLELTANGRVFLVYADRILELAREAEGAMQNQAPRGLLRFGSLEYVASNVLPQAMAVYLQRYPDVQIDIHPGNTSELSQAVIQRQLDAAIVADAPRDERLLSTPLKKEETCLVSASSHSPVRTARDLSNPSLLAFDSGCAFRALLEGWLRAANIQPARVINCRSNALILGCASAGMGFALVPRTLLDAYPHKEALCIHPLKINLRVAVQLIRRRDSSPSPALTAFIATLQSVLQDS